MAVLRSLAVILHGELSSRAECVSSRRLDKGHSKRMRGRCVRVPVDQWRLAAVLYCTRLARYERHA